MAKVTFGDLFPATFRLVFGNLGAYFRTQGLVVLGVLAVAVVFMVLMFGALGAGMMAALSAEDAGSDPSAAGGALALFFVLLLAFIVVSYFLQALAWGSGLATTDALLRGDSPTFGASYAAAKSRVGNVFLTVLLISLATTGIMMAGSLLVFLIVPYLAALVAVGLLLSAWAVALPLSVNERLGAVANLKRSAELTKGSRGAIFGTAFVIYLAFAAIAAVVSIFVVGGVAAGMGFSETPADADPAEIMATMGAIMLPLFLVIGVLAFFVTFLFTAFMGITYRRLVDVAAQPEPDMGPIGSVPMP